MFFRITLLSALLSFGIYWFFVRIQPEDADRYRKLMAESIELRARKAIETEPAFQERQGVQKDIWTHNETHHFRILSQGSELKVLQKKDQIEATENLKQIEGTTPHGFTLLAEEGSYIYPSHQFVAQKNCLLKQGENQIEGNRIDLDLAEEKLKLENPKGHIAPESLDFTAKFLTWEKEANRLYLIDEVRVTQTDDLILLAKKGIVHLEEFKPTQVTLEGNVRLISSRFQNKESFAMADHLTFDPREKTLLFGAEQKVLFWQEGLTLSASEVLIRKDQTIEGHGDVHFTFSLDEQNRIDEFFKQYL